MLILVLRGLFKPKPSFKQIIKKQEFNIIKKDQVFILHKVVKTKKSFKSDSGSESESETEVLQALVAIRTRASTISDQVCSFCLIFV